MNFTWETRELPDLNAVGFKQIPDEFILAGSVVAAALIAGGLLTLLIAAWRRPTGILDLMTGSDGTDKRESRLPKVAVGMLGAGAGLTSTLLILGFGFGVLQ